VRQARLVERVARALAVVMMRRHRGGSEQH
jgi:hypothetical protein